MSFDPKKIDLLLVDDDPDFRESVARRFMRRGFQVQEATHGEQALQLASLRQFDVVVLDMVMPGMSGIQVLEQLKLTHPECEVILLTGQGTIETAVQAMKLGAYDYLTKPFPLAELEILIEKAYERRQLRKENVQLKEVLSRRQAEPEIVGRTRRDAGSISPHRAGRPHRQSHLDSGRKRHRQRAGRQGAAPRSTRADKPMVTINCAALPESLLESELFGHEKGAFTGAVAAKPGLFEVADGGTLFIDEIGELAGSLQAKLLRVLEDGSMRRVGSVKERRVDVRLLAATNRDMAKDEAEGPFSRGLVLPHQRDVVAVAAAARTARRHSPVGQTFAGRRLDDRATGHAGAGSLSLARQCPAVVQRAGTRADHERRQVHLLGSPAARSVCDRGGEHVRQRRRGGSSIADTDQLTEVQRSHVLEILQRERGNKARAARALGINRRSLYRLLEKYGIDDVGGHTSSGAASNGSATAAVDGAAK